MADNSSNSRATTRSAYAWVLGVNFVWIVFATVVQIPLPDRFKDVGIWLHVGPAALGLLFYYFFLRSKIRTLAGDGTSTDAGVVALTQNEIDSIYYLGFILTLLLLGTSAYQIAITPPEGVDLKQLVGAKFACGLLVTGLGLYCRIDLQSINPTADQIPDLLSEYALAIGILNDRISETASSVSETAKSFAKIVDDILQEAKEASRKAGAETLTTIARDLTPAVADLKNVITEINRSFGRFNSGKFSALSDAADKLAKGLLDVAEGAPLVLEQLKSLEDSSKELGEKQAALGSKSENLGVAMDRIGDRIESAGGMAAKAAGEMSVLASSATTASGSIEDLVRVASQSSSSLAPMGDISKVLVDAVAAVGVAVKRLESELAEVSFDKINDSMTLLARELHGFGSDLQGGKESFRRSLAEADVQITAVLEKLGGKAQSLNQASLALAGAMEQMASAIKSAADKAIQDAGV